MADNPTLEEFQSNFPDIFSDENTSATAEADVQMLPWPFCFFYNNRPCGQLTINAPSPEAAAITAEGIVQFLNDKAPRLNYQPLFSAAPGNCQ
jgi:hypothetical protein